MIFAARAMLAAVARDGFDAAGARFTLWHWLAPLAWRVRRLRHGTGEFLNGLMCRCVGESLGRPKVGFAPCRTRMRLHQRLGIRPAACAAQAMVRAEIPRFAGTIAQL